MPRNRPCAAGIHNPMFLTNSPNRLQEWEENECSISSSAGISCSGSPPKLGKKLKSCYLKSMALIMSWSRRTRHRATHLSGCAAVAASKRLGDQEVKLALQNE